MKKGQFKDMIFIWYDIDAITESTISEDTCTVRSQILHKLAMIYVVLSNVIIVVVVAILSTLVLTFCLNFKLALGIRSDVVTWA